MIELVRTGDMDAYGQLWHRYHATGRAAARASTRLSDPDDLVSEAFMATLAAIQNGKGPRGLFRPYLVTVIRHLAGRWASRSREVCVDDVDLEALTSPELEQDSTDEMLVQAFADLPKQWKEVLWYTEVVGLPAADVAVRMRVSANSVAALAYRARDGLRNRWIRAHLHEACDSEKCRWVRARLAAWARDRLSVGDRERIDAHLNECENCAAVGVDAEHLARRIPGVLLPLSLGLGLGGAGWSGAHSASVGSAHATGQGAAHGSAVSNAVAAHAHPIALAGAHPIASAIAVVTTAAVATVSVVALSSGGHRAPQAQGFTPLPVSARTLVVKTVDTCGGVCLPVVNGTAVPGALISVHTGAADAADAGTATTDTDGGWSIAIAALPEGASDLAVFESGQQVANLRVDLHAPHAEQGPDGNVTISGLPNKLVEIRWEQSGVSVQLQLDSSGGGSVLVPGLGGDDASAFYVAPAGRDSIAVPVTSH
ncbi:MAG: sigma-70 family RNA polymerase sigma factor, partial [Actinomycetia bacterium]|nr:sigma-70 family RNA polymerase sigma factor [Actinomycetes bacterium]